MRELLQSYQAWRVPRTLPATVEATSNAGVSELCNKIVAEREELTAQLHHAGAILFRGFGMSSPADLARIVDAWGGKPMRYLGGDSPRDSVGSNVYTSTEAPAHVPIALHNELSYLKRYPRLLWFGCLRDAADGGETLLADGRAVLRALDPSTRERFLERGVSYRCVFRGPGGWLSILDRIRRINKTWMEAFEVDEREAAEARFRELFDSHRWLRSGHLLLASRRPAAISHPDTGELAWFNQAHLFRLNPRAIGRMNYAAARLLFPREETRSNAWYGDGVDIDAAALHKVMDALDAETRYVRWRVGDVVVIDNLLCMHGRRPYEGQRRVLVSMCE
jgi:hypothetical protein